MPKKIARLNDPASRDIPRTLAQPDAPDSAVVYGIESGTLALVS